MPLTLNIDGKTIGNPSLTDIAHAFQTLDKGSGVFTGPGISIVVLTQSDAQFLMATGTHDAGFMLSYQDGDSEWQYDSNPEHAVSVDEVVRIFQSYARGADWGQLNFKWERSQMFIKSGHLMKRLLLISLLSLLVFVFIKRLLAE